MDDQSGVALLEALILVVLISLTAVAVLTLTLSGFLGSAGVPRSQTDKFDALSILSRVHDDLAFCDPDGDGDFDPAANCTSSSDPSKTWPDLTGSPPTTTITYDLAVGVASSRDVSVRTTWCSAVSQYKIGITPCESPGCSAPTVSCP